MAKIRCPQCSAEFERHGDFCPSCGYALTFLKEDEPAHEQHSERIPGEAPPPIPSEEPPPAEEIPPAPEEPPALPVTEMPTAPLPVIERPAPPAPPQPPATGFVVVPPPEIPRKKRGLSLAAKIAIGVVAVVIVGGLVWAFTALLGGDNGQTVNGQQNGSTEQSSTATGTTAPGLTEEESYQLLLTHYEEIDTLSAEIGKAYEGETYGGTGFAYDVFNKLIGAPDKADRESLAAQCETLFAKMSSARQEFESIDIAPAYDGQRDALLELYVLLEDRAQVLLDAATIAVDQPEESAWRPTLSPMSTDLREEFEENYPVATPVRI